MYRAPNATIELTSSNKSAGGEVARWTALAKNRRALDDVQAKVLKMVPLAGPTLAGGGARGPAAADPLRAKVAYDRQQAEAVTDKILAQGYLELAAQAETEARDNNPKGQP